MSTSQVGLSGMTCLKSLPCRVRKNSSDDSDGTGGDSDARHILEIGKLRQYIHARNHEALREGHGSGNGEDGAVTNQSKEVTNRI